MVVLTITNFKLWRKNDKSQFSSSRSNMWRVVCEGCVKDPITPKFLQQDAQARCIIYMNLHDGDLKKLVGLKYAKWEKLEYMSGDGTNNNMENEKNRNKKKKNKNNKRKGLQNQDAQSQESDPPSENDSTNDEKKLENHEPKGININYFLLSCNLMIHTLIMLKFLVKMRMLLRFLEL